MVNFQSAAADATAALKSLTAVIYALEDAKSEAAFWTPQATLDATQAQIGELIRIRDEIGPRLIERIRQGEKSRIEALQVLIANVAQAAQDQAHMLNTELQTSAAVKVFLSETYEDLQQAAADTAKKALPIGALLAGIALLFLLKK
jgi:hypothetical protein